MNKYEYIVKFYYYTDLRTDAKVFAFNEISALAAALEKIGCPRWITEDGFKIEIATINKGNKK